jgi:hypothetical protein
MLQAREPIDAIRLRAPRLQGRAPRQGDCREPAPDGAAASARPTGDRGFHTRGVVSLSIRCGNADIRTYRARRLVLPIFIHRA